MKIALLVGAAFGLALAKRPLARASRWYLLVQPSILPVLKETATVRRTPGLENVRRRVTKAAQYDPTHWWTHDVTKALVIKTR
jgi:hypothetical protein